MPQLIKLTKRGKPKKTAKWGRDFIMVETEKSGPAAALQVQMKKHPDRGVVEFKKIPKLKYTKETDAKFQYIFKYRIQQCDYICSFQEEEKSLARLLASTEAASVEGGGADLQFITMHKTQRKQQRITFSYELNEILQKAKAGAEMGVGSAKEKRKKKPKLRSKDPEINARFIKAEVMEQIANYISSISGYKPVLDDTILSSLINMISINLFIPSATKLFVPPLRLKAGSGRFLCDPVDVPRACWLHRQVIYMIVLNLAICFNKGQGPPEGPKLLNFKHHQLFRTHVGSAFIRHLTDGLQSSDHQERETIIACFQMLAEQCPYTQPFIWKWAKLALLEFSSDGKWDTTRAATQVVSLIEFVEASDCDVDEAFVKDAMFPLYKAPFEVIVRYHPALLKFITKVVSTNHSLIKPLILRLLSCWPVQSASKQLLFLEQVSAIFLEVVARAGQAAGDTEPVKPQEQWKYSDEDTAIFMDVHRLLFNRVCRCLEGEHYEVSVAAIRILDHPAVFFPFVLAPTNVAPVEANPDGSVTARKHPVLSIVYRCFRRVVESHDYVEVRKTINTLMGLLEDHWGDVCEKEIVDEEARQAVRAKRHADMDKLFESVKQVAPHPTRLKVAVHRARPTDPELDADLEGFEHLARSRGQSVFNIMNATGPRKRALSVEGGRKRKSVLLDKEVLRRMKNLEVPESWSEVDSPTHKSNTLTVQGGGRSRALSTPVAPAVKGKRRRGSFELFLAKVGEEEAKTTTPVLPESKRNSTELEKEEKEDSDDSEDGGEIDEDEAEEIADMLDHVKIGHSNLISLPVDVRSRSRSTEVKPEPEQKSE